jgi:streptogramin lyase
MTFGDGALWVIRQRWRKDFPFRAEVLRIDPIRRRVTFPPITVGREADAIIVAGGWIWVANVHDATVSKIDPRRMRVAATLRTPVKGRDQMGLIAFAGGSLWVADNNAYHWQRGGLLWRIDPTTGRVLGPPIHLGRNTCGWFNLTVGLGSLWVAADAEGRLLRVDPATGWVEQRIRVPGAPMRPVVANGALWYVNESQPSQVFRYDVEAQRTSLIHPAPGDVYDLERQGTALWFTVGDAKGSSLVQLGRARPVHLAGNVTDVIARPDGFWAIEWDQDGLAASLVWLPV